MKYVIELDKYELNILKSIVKREYQKAKKDCENKIGFDRDILEDTAFKLLQLCGKLNNIFVVANNITNADASILAKRKYNIR